MKPLLINIFFDTSEDGKSLILDVSGHAGQNEYGKDIICSASSILAFTLAQNVSDMQKEKKLRKKPTIVLKDGKATIVCKPLKEHMAEAFNLYITIRKGYMLLAENYPEYVSLDKV